MDWSGADRGWSFLAEAVPPAASAPQPADYERILQAHCRKTLPESMVPIAFSMHEQFPLNANGKVDRAALARLGLARASSGAPTPTVSPTLGISRSSEELVAIIAREAAAAFDLERVHPDAHFGELGVDSMMALRFRNRLERALDCSLPAELAFNYPTVRSLARHLASEQTQDAATEVDVAALLAKIPAEQLRASGLMEPLLALARSIGAAEAGEQPVDGGEKTADEYLATASVMSEIEIAEKLDSMLGEIRHHG
jgi:acyl carrier protein